MCALDNVDNSERPRNGYYSETIKLSHTEVLPNAIDNEQDGSDMW